ncbi:hypothetical protein J5X84_21370 [Streptosporangiaceae bacterium NEAU-GS5]|nr:hypothetical protein [Streptosporangiaceae bacterium NEAU-GS5]
MTVLDGLPRVTEVAAEAATYTLRQIFFNLRLAARIACATMLGATGVLPPAEAVAAGVLACAWDVVMLRAIKRGLALRHRLLLDAADVAIWSCALGYQVDAPALIAAPLAIDAALLRGVRAVAVPLVTGILTAGALRLTHHPPSLAPFLWPSFGLVSGLVIRHYLERRVHLRLRTAEAERQAARSQAVLAGRHSLAAGADTIVDVLTRTWPLLALPGHQTGSPLTAWRMRLAQDACDHAEYLRTALLQWEQQHNAAGPDLSRDVEFGPVDDGVLLLSPGQVAALGTALSDLGLSGRVPVRGIRTAPLGNEQVLSIGGHRVTLPADPRTCGPALDLGPPVIAIGGVGSLAHSWPDMDKVPLAATGALALLAFAIALWAHRQVVRHGSAAHPRILAAAMVHGSLDAIVSTALMGNLMTGGLTRMPFLHFLLWMSPLTVVYLPDLTARARAAAITALILSSAGSAALLPVSLHAADFTTLVWPLAFTMGARGMRDLLYRDGATLSAVISREHEAAVEGGYAAGRADVLHLVERATHEADDRVRRHRGRLDPCLLPEIDRRLAVVHRRLAALRKAEDPRLAALRKAEDPRLAALRKAEGPRLAVLPEAEGPRLAALPKAEDPRLS